MAKKKVSGKTSSSSSTNSKIHNIKNIEKVSGKKNSKKAKPIKHASKKDAEILAAEAQQALVAPIAPASMKPVVVAAQQAKPSVETKVAEPQIQSIYASDSKSDEETRENRIEVSQQTIVPEPKIYKETESETLKIVGTILCGIIIVFWLVVFLLSLQISSGPYIVEKNISTIKKVPLTLSFDERLQGVGANETQISLYGYLRKEKVQTSDISTGTVYYILDDNGKRITAKIRQSKRLEYERLFTDNPSIKTAYNITGTYRYSMGEYILDDVYNIQPYTKTYVETSESRLENVTINQKRGITINATKGWTKIQEMLG